jgi:hypothetical protein
MISASSPTASWMMSLISVASPSVRSWPPMMLMRTPVAPAMETLSRSGLEMAVLALTDAGAHQRGAAVLHDGPHVGEVDVDDPGVGDEARDALGGVQQHLIGLLERVLEGNPLPDHREQPLVGHHDHGVHVAAHLGDAHVGLLHPLPSLEQERLGDDADRERANVAGELRDDGGGSCAGAAAHAAGDEDEVGAVQRLAHFVTILLDGLAPDLGARARAQSPGQLLPDLDLDVGLGGAQGLGIGVHRDELDPLEPFLDHAVDRVAAAAADPDHLHPGALPVAFLKLESHRGPSL